MTPPIGHVALVGAGPGDPGLMTVRARELLERAEVVLYDALVPDTILSLAPERAVRIDVGRRAGDRLAGSRLAGGHTTEQEERNRLLLEYARAGKRVVRLKGGDPFTFGRGGEEALSLAGAGIPFEVVPGVTSGIAAPACAGIPVTHRGVSSSVLFVTAHGQDGKPWGGEGRERLCGAGTIVCYMMGGAPAALARELVRAGRDVSEPAAIVSNGSLPTQRTEVTTLGALAEGNSPDLPAPRLLVVGGTVALRGEIAWFERRALFGRTILVTRAEDQAPALVEPLRALGANVIPCPCIRIGEAQDPDALDSALRRKWDWIVLTSPNGVASLARTLARLRADARVLAGARIAAVGPATVSDLLGLGVRADFEPSEATSRCLAEELPGAASLRGKNLLLWQADAAGPELADRLRATGADVARVNAYRTQRADAFPSGAAGALRDLAVDAVTFTSGSSVRHFQALVPDDLRPAASALPAFCIGPTTASAARATGFGTIHTAAPHTVSGLTDLIQRVFHK
ncbi:MAG: uroporphyrinogen-III C-methyltransferase [Planctomycetes bacterium]|nr:uroporphyrinogen-III C-methyltransferase [Planctomycetota bacterium]